MGEAVHVIKVSSSTSSTSSTSITSTPGVSSETTRPEGREFGVEATTGAIEHLDYYESYDNQEYPEATADIDNKLEDTEDTTTDTGAASAYNKYSVEVEIERKAEEDIDHVLLET